MICFTYKMNLLLLILIIIVYITYNLYNVKENFSSIPAPSADTSPQKMNSHEEHLLKHINKDYMMDNNGNIIQYKTEGTSSIFYPRVNFE